MDRFHNHFGTMNEEATNIISELELAVTPILDKYKDDIEAIVFMNKALTFMFSVVSEYTLLYAHRQNKKLEKQMLDKKPGER